VPPKSNPTKEKSDTADPSINSHRPDVLTGGQDLRRQAETKLKKSRQGKPPAPMTDVDTQRLLHELQVHQIELEMQNDELVQSRTALDVALKQFTDLYDFAPVGYFTLAPDGTILQVNLGGANMLGVDRSKLIKRRFGLFVSVSSRSTFTTFLENTFAGLEKGTCEITLLKDGQESFWVHIEATSQDGLECRAAVMDITDRKRVERTLQDSQTQLQGIFNSAMDAIITIDNDHHIIIFNPAAEHMFGCSASEAFGGTLDRFIPEYYRSRHNEAIHAFGVSKSSRRTMQTPALALTCLRADGEMFPSEVSISQLELGGKKLYSATIRDITDRKLVEEKLQRTLDELERSNTDLEQFAYVASHDLQEPLRMVSSYVQLLERRYKGKLDKDADVFIGFAVDGVQRMERLINDLLAFARLGTRGQPFALASCDAALDQALDNLQLAILENKAKVTRMPLPEVLADETQLVQLFQNLVGNAVKFHDEKRPRVHISVESGKKEWVFSVRDNGIGIGSQYADRIFVIFQRLHDRSHYEGTGIGLAMCKKIVQHHGGRIWVESSPGKGATFFFTLPKSGGDKA
jgi:PAS domain S-box-containing protein